MKDSLLVCEAQHFCNLSDQVESIINSQAILIDFQVMIEANQRSVMFKNQCWAEFMLRESFEAKNTRMRSSSKISASRRAARSSVFRCSAVAPDEML